MLKDILAVQFWGLRGNLPVPGNETLTYGGNTNCVTLTFADHQLFIFDAGSGIKSLAEHLKKSRSNNITASVFISHPHWDHINALPHFDPFYAKGNQFAIYGACNDDTTLEQLIFGQMKDPHYPITIKEMSAQIAFHRLKEESFNIDDIHIQTMRLNHPGFCLGYRVTYQNKVFCYVTDNELPFKGTPAYDQTYVDKLQNFVKYADLLVIDSTYSDDEYQTKVGWGHSCTSQVVTLAHDAKVKQLCLFHHCPIQKDREIDEKIAEAGRQLKALQSTTICLAPSEGDILQL